MSAEAQRRLILHMSVSLDGFVARRDGVIDWLDAGRSGVDHGNHRPHANLEMLGQIGLIVLGEPISRASGQPYASRASSRAEPQPRSISVPPFGSRRLMPSALN
jgi:hypothetical protein